MTKFNLGKLDWKLSGCHPWIWKLGKSMELGEKLQGDIIDIPAKVPGSVQKALFNSGIIKDWNLGLNSLESEWVENRHWIFSTTIPADYFKERTKFNLNFQGLDYCGIIFINGKEKLTFQNTHLPLNIDITENVKQNDNKNIKLEIVFLLSPRWLGQFGYTYKMTDWKTRFNYYWDWVVRLVQVGIWDDVTLEAYDEKISKFRCCSSCNGKTGKLELKGEAEGSPDNFIYAVLNDSDGKTVCKNSFSVAEFHSDKAALKITSPQLWFPNGKGKQPLYSLTVQLKNKSGYVLDEYIRKIGFRKVDWLPCENAREDADPWICEVNGEKLFIQGVNWTPLLPNFADVSEKRYRRTLQTYKDMGVNLLRVWGGGFLEKEIFYNLCDEMGLMVWQEFPLSSSGIDNSPPTDTESIKMLGSIAREYIKRKQHHVSLIIWCGGNELSGVKGEIGLLEPVDNDHPTIKNLYDIVSAMDPDKRFVPSSPSGPRSKGTAEDFEKKVLWDTHGPWKAVGPVDGQWKTHWEKSNALLYGEFGAPGASSVEIIEKYKGTLNTFPCSQRNKLWNRQPWWIEWDTFVELERREPENLEEYVAWSQKRQSDLLCFAVSTAKSKFPKCAGVIIWMGHDCFPCTANTSIIDFEGNMKPAAKELAKIFNFDISGKFCS